MFGPPEEVERCLRHPAHLYRWTIFGKRDLRVALYHSDGAWSGELSECPERFISIGLANQAIEREQNISYGVKWMVMIGNS